MLAYLLTMGIFGAGLATRSRLARIESSAMADAPPPVTGGGGGPTTTPIVSPKGPRLQLGGLFSGKPSGGPTTTPVGGGEIDLSTLDLSKALPLIQLAPVQAYSIAFESQTPTLLEINKLDKQFHWLYLLQPEKPTDNGSVSGLPVNVPGSWYSGHDRFNDKGKKTYGARATIVRLATLVAQQKMYELTDWATGEPIDPFGEYMAFYSITEEDIKQQLQRAKTKSSPGPFGALVAAVKKGIAAVGSLIKGDLSKGFFQIVGSTKSLSDAVMYMSQSGAPYTPAGQRRPYSPEEWAIIDWMRDTLTTLPYLDEKGAPLALPQAGKVGAHRSRYTTSVLHALTGQVPLMTALQHMGGVTAFESAIRGATAPQTRHTIRPRRPLLSTESRFKFSAPGSLALRAVMLARSYFDITNPHGGEPSIVPIMGGGGPFIMPVVYHNIIPGGASSDYLKLLEELHKQVAWSVAPDHQGHSEPTRTWLNERAYGNASIDATPNGQWTRDAPFDGVLGFVSRWGRDYVPDKTKGSAARKYLGAWQSTGGKG